MAEEREFEVIDKRRGATADTSGTEQSEETANESPAPEAEGAGDDIDEDMDGEGPEMHAGGPASALDIVTMSLGMLNEIAWVKMGLVPDPMSGQMSPDLKEARLAIDCAGDLAHRLSSHVDGKTQRELETLVQNLKLNYVKQQTKHKGEG